jgi:transposase InsO family protein
VLRLLRGEDLETLSRELGVTAATLCGWREQFLEGGAANLKAREADVDNEETQRLKSLVADLSMSNELLREKIHRMEAGRPLVWRRPKPCRAASPFTERRYGVARVTREWELARSSFYYQRGIAAQPDRVLQRRGPKTAWSDAALLEKIREVIAASPFYGEGHRKVWARLRFQEVRTSKARVLRLMREAQLLAPSRTFPKAANPHTGTIITARPNEVWASDHTMTATVEEGHVTVFVAVDHCTTECVGLHAAKKATRFEALEPLRQGVRDYCGGFRAGAAAGIRNRHDHGSQYMSDDYQAEIAFLGMESSPSFVRQPECNGCVERFIRTLKEQLLWVRVFRNVEELRCALAEFRERYNQRWIVQRLGYLTPAQARQQLLAIGAAA